MAPSARMLLAAVTATLAMSAACSGRTADPPLSRQEFTGRAGLVCAELRRQAQLADDVLAGAAPPADMRRVVANFAPVVARARQDLAELRPPATRRAAFDRYLAALERARVRLADAGRRPDAAARLAASGQGVLPAMDDIEAAVGLTACRPPEADPAVQDDQIQTSLRSALIAEQLVFANEDAYTEDAADLRLIETLRYAVGLRPTKPATVNVKVDGGGATVFLSARSRSGRCFYLRARDADVLGYATDDACGPADTQTYLAAW